MMLRTKPGYTREQVIAAFLALKRDKQGVREVVGEVLDRNTRASARATRKVAHIEWVGPDLLATAKPLATARPGLLRRAGSQRGDSGEVDEARVEIIREVRF